MGQDAEKMQEETIVTYFEIPSQNISLDLPSLGDPTGINATAGLALRVTGTHKPLHHGKVEIPL
jgi:hypothetical protein